MHAWPLRRMRVASARCTTRGINGVPFRVPTTSATGSQGGFKVYKHDPHSTYSSTLLETEHVHGLLLPPCPYHIVVRTTTVLYIGILIHQNLNLMGILRSMTQARGPGVVCLFALCMDPPRHRYSCTGASTGASVPVRSRRVPAPVFVLVWTGPRGASLKSLRGAARLRLRVHVPRLQYRCKKDRL